MAQTVLLKRSSVAGNVPGSSDLALGEIAVNTADGAVYIKKGNNDIVAVADNDILHINTSNSRVGIGTTSPTHALTVNGDVQIEGTGSGNTSHTLYFKNSAAAIQRVNNNLKLHAYDAMIFGVSTTAYPTSTERMRITSSGLLE